MEELEKTVETTPTVTPPVETPPVATGEAKTEGTVDLAPDTKSLESEIERLKQVRKKAEEDASYWRRQKAEARAEYFKGRQESPPVAERTEDLGIGNPPDKNSFDDYDKYLDAKMKYEVTKAKVEWDRDLARRQSDSEKQKRIDDLREKIKLGYQEFPDFEEVALTPDVPITPMIAEIMAECEKPHQVAYYLGKNREETIRISRMNPIRAAREIAKIEVEIAKAVNQPPVAPKIPNAPPPIKPVGSSHTVSKSPDKMTQKEYEAWANQNPGLRRF